MNNTVGAGRRLVVRVVMLQLVAASLSGVLFWFLDGALAAAAAVTGGVIAAVGTALLGWRMFSPGIAPAKALNKAMFAGEALKWLWYLIAMAAAFAILKLKPLPLLVGLIMAQFGYWFGLVGTKRG